MKRFIFVLILPLIISCSQTTKKSTDYPQFFGEFLYLSDAAVLNTGTEIYGVIIDEKMQELDDLCKPIKRDDYDMIPVYIKGIIQDNTAEEGWDKLIQITSIDSLVNPTDKSIIKPNN
tara:strand:+ start:2287 stop:2640 length:354 start_codon:yes stop_codon:yes gene_type:complete